MKLQEVLIHPRPTPLLLTAIIIFSLSVPPIARAAAPVTYYVSNAGRDDYSGLSEASPLASIEKVNSLPLQPGDRLLFKCGDEWEATPLTITRSGTAGLPITFSSYPAACPNQPLLSGSRPISGWTGSGTANLYYADLNASANAGKFPNGINQLFRNGTRLTLGRWPNLDDPAFDHGYSFIESQPGARQLTDDQLPSGNWSGAVAHIRGMRWYILNRQVTGQSGTTLTVGADLDCWDGCAGWGYFLNNSLAALDREGEWYYSPADGRVYLYSTGGTPQNIEGSVILKTGSDAGRFWGGITLGQDLTGQGIAFVTVENLHIERWFKDGIAFPTNFAHYEPHDLILRNNTIREVDSTGIRLMTWVYDASDGRPDGWRGGYNLLITGNTIQDANRMGIDLQSRNSTFSGNLISDIGRIQNLGAAGMGCSFSDGEGQCTEDGDGIRVKVDQPNDSGNTNTISGNRLERIGHNGMDIFGHHNGVARNVIREACYSKGDCGGVRTFGNAGLSQTPVYNLTFADNIILDTIGNTDGCRTDFKSLFGFGLYIDNYSRDISITGNTIQGSTAAGILIQNSTAAISGNTLYDNARGSMYTGQLVITEAPSLVTSLMDNVFYSLKDTAWTLDAADKARLVKSSHNYFFNPYRADPIAVEGARTLAQWQAFSGQDTDSVENWFSLPAGSPPNSEIFINETGQSSTIDLGTQYYKDLDENPVYGSLVLPAYRSRVLVHAGEMPELRLTMATGSTDTLPNGAVSYTLTVTNQGSAPAAGITLTHVVPASIIGASWNSAIPGVSLHTGSRYVWNLPNLAPASSLTITVTGQFAETIPPGLPIGLFAQVSASTPDANPANNSAALLLGTWLKIQLPLINR